MEQPTPFDIRITRQVIFKDWNGTITRTYNVGDVIKATAANESAGYFVHSYGGIWFDEAERV